MKNMIVKVQVPLAKFGFGEPEALIYNKDKSVLMQIPLTEQIQQLMGKDFKRYYHVKVDPNSSELTFGNRAPAQNW